MSQTISPLVKEMITQNRVSCGFALSMIDQTHAGLRMSPEANSVGFIYRHIGETTLLFGYFFGIPPTVENTTMGKQDTGQGQDISESRELIEKGYQLFEELAQTATDNFWMEEVDTPFFGKVSRFRLFSHVMYHIGHHSGQIAMTISKMKP